MEIRVGICSGVIWEKGMVRVTYPDLNDTVTPELPILACGEYNMPEIGKWVAVLHFTGTEKGICLGEIANENQLRGNPKKGNFYKKLGSASMQVVDGELSFTDKHGTVYLKNLIGSE